MTAGNVQSTGFSQGASALLRVSVSKIAALVPVYGSLVVWLFDCLVIWLFHFFVGCLKKLLTLV